VIASAPNTSIANYKNGVVRATCPAGTTLVGGGGQMSSNTSATESSAYAGLVELGSYPEDSNTWAYFVNNTRSTTVTIDMFAYALCAKL